MAVQLQQVLATARTLMNDDLGVSYPDETLIPKVQEAHRELQTKLWNAGSPVVRRELLINSLPALSSSLGLLTPIDLITPFEIWENAPNAPLNDANWLPITESYSIPMGISPGNKIEYWAWREEQVLFLPASQSRSILLKYRKRLPFLNIPTDDIGIIAGELYLAARSVALLAGSLGNETVHDKLTERANMNLDEIFRANRGYRVAT